MNTALQILALIIHLEGGYMPEYNFMIYDNNRVSTQEKFYANIGAEFLLFDFAFVGADIRTEMSMYELKSGGIWPYMANYGFYFGIRPVDGIEIGFRHHCVHPMMPYSKKVTVDLHYEGAYEEIYVKIDKKIDLF